MKIKNILFAVSTATVLISSLSAWADSPSDLLEQGVYSEETKGDLDGAMQLYQKVIDQSKSDQALAAQAQYHLGICYYKKKDFATANATFEALIKNYPGQKDVIGLARKYLAGVNALQPAPWSDGEDLRMDIKLAGGLSIGMVDYNINSGVATNGDKIWRINSHTVAATSQSASHVEVAADTFGPIHSYWHHNLLGMVDAVYYSDHADLQNLATGEVTKVTLDNPVIDNEEAVEWMRRLPLATGFSISQDILSTLTYRVIPLKLDVTNTESVTVPAGTFDCFKIQLNIGQSFWYSADAKRYLVKFEAGGVVAELTGISQRTAGEKAAYSDSSLGFSATAPAGWLFYNETSKTNEYTILRVVDPNVLATSTLGVRTLASLKPSETNSLRGYAAHVQEDETEVKKNFKIRADSWKDTSVAGQPALSFVSDYLDGETPKVTYTVCSFVGSHGVVFVMSATAGDLATLRSQWDSVIASFQGQ